MEAIRDHKRRERQSNLGVSIEVYRDAPAKREEDTPGSWWRADVVVNGEIVATGFAKTDLMNTKRERDELARSEAIVKARHAFKPPINVRDV